jgi:hypothetical protein
MLNRASTHFDQLFTSVLSPSSQIPPNVERMLLSIHLKLNEPMMLDVSPGRRKSAYNSFVDTYSPRYTNDSNSESKLNETAMLNLTALLNTKHLTDKTYHNCTVTSTYC